MTKGLISLGAVAVLMIGGWFAWHAWQDRAREAAYHDGLALIEEERYEDALALAEPYADSGDPDFDHLMAEILLAAPEPLGDEDRGIALQRRAADAGQHRAGAKLARRLLEGAPSQEDFDRAFGYLTAAAECGMPDAHFQLGWLYVKSDYLERDLDFALKHSEIAAWSGYPEAQWNVSVLIIIRYENTEDIPDSEGIRAFAWRFASAQFGVPQGRRYLDRAESEGWFDESTFFREAREEGSYLIDQIDPWGPFLCGFSVASISNSQ